MRKAILILSFILLSISLFAQEGVKSKEQKNEDDPAMDKFVEVEKMPEIIFQAKPVYPDLAVSAKLEGRVWVKILVSKEGKPKKAVVVKSDAEIFNQSAMDAAMKYAFTPALQNNKPVAVWVVVPFKFELGNNNTFTDPRDGHVYKTVTIGSQIWMAENLAYKAKKSCWAYNNNESNVEKYGRLYTSEVAKNICPVGWHLPSDAEWTILTNYLGGEEFAGGKLKSTSDWESPNTGATNESGFSALPGGQRGEDGSFSSIGEYGIWWYNAEYPDVRELGLAFAGVNSGNGRYIETGSHSIRCIMEINSKDKKVSKLVVNPQNEGGGFGQVSFSKNKKTLFYFEQKSQKGKIVLNDTEYILNKCDSEGNNSKASYKLFGSGVIISALNCKVSDVGDCFHGKCAKVTITLNGISIAINNVEYTDCLSFSWD